MVVTFAITRTWTSAAQFCPLSKKLSLWRRLTVLLLCALPAFAFFPHHSTITTTSINYNPRLAFSANKLKYYASLTLCYKSTTRINARTRGNASTNSTTTKIKIKSTKSIPKKRTRRSWEEMYPRLKQYKKIHGHSNVTTTDDPELYRWVQTLRQNYIHQIRKEPDPTGKRKRLPKTKLKQLENLNFFWETKPSGTRARWNVLLERLGEFKKEHGHTNVGKDDDDFELYKWTKYLRYTYRHQALNLSDSNSYKPRLTTPKMQQLRDIGFNWGLEKKASFDVMIEKLAAYKEKHGHTIVQQGDDAELYQWTINLVKNYGPQLSNSTTSKLRHTLSEDKVKQLRGLNFTWERRASMWEQRYQELKTFISEHGHSHPQVREYPQLANFAKNLRREYRRYLVGNVTSMTEERVQALEKIDFEWSRPHEVAWEERRSDLEDFLENYGHVNVPQKYEGNFRLGRWCMNQRTFLRIRNAGKRTGLTGDRIQKLEKLGFQWNIKEAQWNAMVDRLRRYQEEHGNFDISTSDSENQDLRLWLNLQRYFYTNKQQTYLSQERIEQLESIPEFSWRRTSKGPTKKDWSDLFVAIREKGIAPDAKAKQHWFDGAPRFDANVKTQWTEQELLALWNEENDDDDDDDFDYEEEFSDDEDSRMFLRA